MPRGPLSTAGGRPVAWEYSSYLMAASFTFGAAMTLRVGGHIRVVLLLKNVPPPLQRAIEILSAAAGFAFMAFLTSSMAKFAFGAYVRGQVSTSSDTPLWFPEAVVTFGMLLLTLQFLARAIQAVPTRRSLVNKGPARRCRPARRSANSRNSIAA